SILIDDFAIRIGDNEDNYASITGIVGGLQTEVSKKVDENIYNSKVTQLSDAIESKMSLSDADGRYTKTTTFTQTINGIQSDISKKVDTTTYNSKITQLSDQRQSKISTTDANSRFTTQTVFNQFADSFSTRVEEIENWEIGGTNLVLDSEEEKAPNNTYSAWYLAERFFKEYDRSEEHTSELQSRFDLVCRLLLEKKKKNT